MRHETSQTYRSADLRSKTVVIGCSNKQKTRLSIACLLVDFSSISTRPPPPLNNQLNTYGFQCQSIRAAPFACLLAYLLYALVSAGSLEHVVLGAGFFGHEKGRTEQCALAGWVVVLRREDGHELRALHRSRRRSVWRGPPYHQGHLLGQVRKRSINVRNCVVVVNGIVFEISTIKQQ